MATKRKTKDWVLTSQLLLVYLPTYLPTAGEHQTIACLWISWLGSVVSKDVLWRSLAHTCCSNTPSWSRSTSFCSQQQELMIPYQQPSSYNSLAVLCYTVRSLHYHSSMQNVSSQSPPAVIHSRPRRGNNIPAMLPRNNKDPPKRQLTSLK